MYPKLNELGLSEYVSKYCGGSTQQNKYFNKIEKFIDSMSKTNYDVLKSKFKGNTQHSAITDLLREIEIAYLFHPKANFIDGPGPDLENGTNIEVKSLNEGKEENERHENSNTFSFISHQQSDGEKRKENQDTIEAIKNKINFHLEKANAQLNGNGLIYLIWDYNLILHSTDGSKHISSIDKEEAKRITDECVISFIKCHPCLTIRHYYFEDIREMIENSSISHI